MGEAGEYGKAPARKGSGSHGRPRKDAAPDELRLLAYVRDAAPGPRSKAVVSTAEMAGALGFSPAKTKALRKSMEERGLLMVWERHAESGAQMENAYRPTRKGRRLLAAHEGTAPAE